MKYVRTTGTMCVNSGEMLGDTVVALGGFSFGHMYRDIGPDPTFWVRAAGGTPAKFGSESTSLKVALSRAQPPLRVYDTKDLDYGRASNTLTMILLASKLM